MTKRQRRYLRRQKAARSRETIQFRTGEPLSYGSNWKLPRTQERVPRSLLARSLMVGSKGRFTERFSTKRIAVRRSPKALQGVTPRTQSSRGVFRFKSPFFRQYQQLKAVGNMVRHPKKVALCVGRKIRREVLFARRLTRAPGRGGSVRRTQDSLVSC